MPRSDAIDEDAILDAIQALKGALRVLEAAAEDIGIDLEDIEDAGDD